MFMCDVSSSNLIWQLPIPVDLPKAQGALVQDVSRTSTGKSNAGAARPYTIARGVLASANTITLAVVATTTLTGPD